MFKKLCSGLLSDVDFLRFYQEPMSMLSAEGDSHMHFMAGYRELGKGVVRKGNDGLNSVGCIRSNILLRY